MGLSESDRSSQALEARGGARTSKGAVFVAAIVMAIVFLQAAPARAGEITKFVITNSSKQDVTIHIGPKQRCVEPGMQEGFIGGSFTIPPGASFAKEIARQSGHGCDGKNALFDARPVYPRVNGAWQRFAITGAGEFGLEGKAFGYAARGTQVTAPQPFVWELFMDLPVAPTTPRQPTTTGPGPRTDSWRPFKSTVIEIFQLRSSRYEGSALTQYASGGDDAKRNVVVGPQPRRVNLSYRWVLDGAGGDYWYISNLQSGLVLTQDGSGANRKVSNWGRQSPPNPRQQWAFVPGPNGVYQIVNRATNQSLAAQPNGSVTTDPRPIFWNVVDSAEHGLAKLTIEEVTAIHVSTGQDKYTDALFTAIDIAAEVAMALASGGASAAKTAALAAAKQAGGLLTRAGLRAGARAVTKEVIKKGARAGLKEGVKDKIEGILREQAQGAILEAVGAPKIEELIGDDAAELLANIAELTTSKGLFNKLYGESPDQLYITANGVSVWPNGGRDHRDTKSQQRQPVGAEWIFDSSTPLRIELWDQDYGSNDDSLGYINWNGGSLPVRYEDLLVGDPEEGSLYNVTYKIESFPKPVITTAMVVGNYRAEPVRLKSDIGSISDSKAFPGKRFVWTPGVGNPISLIPNYDKSKLDTNGEVDFKKLGYDEFKLIMAYDKVVGFEWLDAEFRKVS